MELKTTANQQGRPGSEGQMGSLDTAMYWEAQGLQDSRGYGHAGQAWYRSAVSVPADAEEKPLRLAIGGLYGNELWTWINGRLVDHGARLNTRSALDIDVSSHIRPSQTNQIALLIES